MEHNPYSAPQASVELESRPEELQPADRWTRLGAAFIDGFMIMIFVLPTMYFAGVVDMILANARTGRRFDLQVILLSFVIGITFYVLLQGYPLAVRGQTWGKKLLKLKIVDLQGRKPELWRLLVLRYGITRLIGMVPIAGGLYALVDDLFIFRDDRRCIHDHIAGTRVVVAD